MEKAILKTIIYADVFNFPLKGWEIHKWLIGAKCSLIQIQQVISRLVKKGKIQELKGYYFLPGRKALVARRINCFPQSRMLLGRAKLVAIIFKIIPWVKLIGVSGALSMENAGAKDDIDLFVVTAKNRLWTSRLLMLGVLGILRLRRKSSDSKRQAAGKVCLNLILEEDRLEQKRQDLYTAHEVLQMKLLWQRDNMYEKFLEINAWVFKFLPNWIGNKNA